MLVGRAGRPLVCLMDLLSERKRLLLEAVEMQQQAAGLCSTGAVSACISPGGADVFSPSRHCGRPVASRHPFPILLPPNPTLSSSRLQPSAICYNPPPHLSHFYPPTARLLSSCRHHSQHLITPPTLPSFHNSDNNPNVS